MLLTEYLSDLAKLISNYSKTDLILSSKLMIDARTERIGLVKCTIVFINESKLFSTEYLDLRYKVEKLTYSFHYQDKDGNLIFRYDNAAHKPTMTCINHKHIKDNIIESEVTELKDILEEIISDYLK